MSLDLEAIRARHAAIVPGPWRWELNPALKQVSLVGGVPRYDLSIMDFVRYGFSGAAPRFQIEHRPGLNIMHRADEFGVVQPGREHHADWFKLIDQPDANFMAAAPEDVRELIAEVDRLRKIEMVATDPDLLGRIREDIRSARTVKKLFEDKRPGESAIECDKAIEVGEAFLAAIAEKGAVTC